MPYALSMGAETVDQAPQEQPAQQSSALLDLRAQDFSARINQPSLNWFPFWLGAGAGLFVGWLIFRGGSGSKQLEQIQQAAISRVFGEKS